MSKLLIDYNLKDLPEFNADGKTIVSIQRLNSSLKQFCIRLTFKVTNPVTKRQTLAESTGLPFSIFIDKPVKSGAFDLFVRLNLKSHGWSGPDTCFKKSLQLNQWYSIALVYDFDTAALFVNNRLISVHGFPDGTIVKATQDKLYLGTWVDGRRDHFTGKMTTFQWYDGIPDNYESLVDERRNFPEWHITYKYESFRKGFNTGKRTGRIKFKSATGAHIQYYDRCAISFHDSLGAAFEMHGAIFTKFKSMTNASKLGYLVTDEVKTTKNGGRKSLFSEGGIYWSSGTGAVSVKGQIYLDYENMGESKELGYPIQKEKNISNGKEQRFQGCRMYYRNGDSNAHEVHGAILQKFLTSGGVNKWGYPMTNESDLKNGSTTIGKSSEFEGCIIYWKSSTGAFEVHGHILKKYLEIGGPTCAIGFPTSDEKDIPSYSGAGRANTFEKGSILWYGSYSSIVIARPFKLFLGRINSRESEGIGMGQNDIYLRVKIKDGSTFIHNKRYPNSGDYGNHNVKTLNKNFPVTITPNTLNKRVIFSTDIWDADPFDDDHLGYYSYELNASNGWGLRHSNGTFDSSFSKIRSMTWSVKPVVNTASLSEIEKWWGVSNRGTSTVSWQQCAAAFRDIDSDTEWWDVTDWLQKAFYELAVKGIASGGNCFGMSVEGIHARKNTSVFGLPINRFTNWNVVRNEFNIKQSYQVGAGPIWWFLGQFISGNTHDPKDVFNRTRYEFGRGNNPVVCIAQNYDFSGGPHCILPVAWDSSTKPWKMTICDPNSPGLLKTLTVDPDNNTFRYIGSRTYTGGAWSGGRFHYMPFSLLNSPPRTPIWDAIVLLLCGTIIILADDTETVSIKDGNNRDLNAHGSRAKQLMKNGHRPDEFFVQFSPMNPSPSQKPGRILMRKEDLFAASNAPGTSTIINFPINEVVRDRRAGSLRTLLRSNRSVESALSGRLVHYAVNDSGLVASLPADVLTGMLSLNTVNASRNFVHSIKSTKSGNQEYVFKHKLTEIKLNLPVSANEIHKVEMADLGSSKMSVKLHSNVAKQIQIQIVNKIGIHGDYFRYEFSNLPLSGSKPLNVNIKQGFGGIELINPSGPVSIQVKISALVNGKAQEKTFSLPLDKGARLKPAEFVSTRRVTVSKIENLFGPTLGSTQF